VTRVLVHGVPETAAIWDDVRAELDGDVVTLGLPGFGTPRPAGFGATKDEYADWLRGELDALEPPIDLVGHDWGGILTTHIVTSAPGGIRSWATDALTTVDPGFEWHDLAKVWQTPGEGEEFWANVRAAPDDSAVLFASFGIPQDRARSMIDAMDETMTGCILDLYRSATTIGRDWEARGAVALPGIVLVGSEDPYADLGKAGPVVERLGARVVTLEGAGHFWPVQHPAAAARALEEFWADLPG
jgi:pimeloyl-ACP methyl ester carboxylesterase